MWQQDGRYAGCSRSPSPPTGDLGASSECSCTGVGVHLIHTHRERHTLYLNHHTYITFNIQCSRNSYRWKLIPPVLKLVFLQRVLLFLLPGILFLCSIFLFSNSSGFIIPWTSPCLQTTAPLIWKQQKNEEKLWIIISCCVHLHICISSVGAS